MYKKNILITGGSGFIGSNFISYIIEKHNDYRVINVDKLTYASNIENNHDVTNKNNYIFKNCDICNPKEIEDIFKEYNITDVIHFAAESHVDNSINSPEQFIHTNIVGTFNLLELSRKFWMLSPGKHKDKYKSSKFIHISTDEVFGSLEDSGYFTESTAYDPSSPYSSSKASSDLIAKSYFRTYGLNVTITNCSNNYGPRQHDEKLIPTIIRNAISLKPIPIYGNGKNIRDWLYVIDHCTAIQKIFSSGIAGESYNIGGDCELRNIDLCNLICEKLDQVKPIPNNKSYKELITFVMDRPGHDKRYAIDNSKIKKELGWQPKFDFPTGLQETINWYVEKYSNIERKTVLN